MKLKLKTSDLSLGSISDQYADVFIHIENKNKEHSLLKANKVILASHSPYFHRAFQSRENIQQVDFNFVGIHPMTIKDAIHLIYGKCVEILDKHFNRFCAFLRLLEIEYEISTYREADTPSQDQSVTETTVSDDTLEQIPQTKEILPTIWQAEDQVSCDIDRDLNQPMQSSKGPEVAPIAMPSSSVPKDKKTATFPSVPRPNTIDEENDDEPFPDNWTETPESRLYKLKDIDFKVGKTFEKEHCEYVCLHCSLIVKAIALAENHYIHTHQNCDKEIKIMHETINYRILAIESFSKMKAQIRDGCNKVLAGSQLTTIAENLRSNITTLEEMEKKNLSPNMVRKRRDMMKAIGETASKIEDFVNRL